jgi:hypothetical protein
VGAGPASSLVATVCKKIRGSELTAIHKGVDVALRQRFLQTVLRGALGNEIILVLERR